jgi:hypothetical protein
MINEKAIYKAYNPSRSAYNILSPNYNFGGNKEMDIRWNWHIPCLNCRFNYYYIRFKKTDLHLIY